MLQPRDSMLVWKCTVEVLVICKQVVQIKDQICVLSLSQYTGRVKLL